MSKDLDPLAVARQPTQLRARERFERILQESEKLLIEGGLSGFSIPVLAERLDYTRGSVYAYFPTPYAILNELVYRYLQQLEQQFVNKAQRLHQMEWRDSIAAIIKIAVEFHNSHPAARLLILGGAVTDDSYRAQEQANKRLGELGRRVWPFKVPLPKGPPDVSTLAADIGTACFRRSYFEHGEITPAYQAAAVTAMTSFLSRYVEAAAAEATATRRRAAGRK
jgi:AcrR family transcriptional regulator